MKTNWKSHFLLSLIFVLIVAAVVSSALLITDVIRGRSHRVRKCGADDLCGSNQKCENRVCVYECTKNTNCNADQVCFKGRCHTSPTSYEECACKDGNCNHCNGGGTCTDSGVCVPTPSPDCDPVTAACELKNEHYCDLNEQCVNLPPESLNLALATTNQISVSKKTVLSISILFSLAVLFKAWQQLRSGDISDLLLRIGIVTILSDLVILLLTLLK